MLGSVCFLKITVLTDQVYDSSDSPVPWIRKPDSGTHSVKMEAGTLGCRLRARIILQDSSPRP